MTSYQSSSCRCRQVTSLRSLRVRTSVLLSCQMELSSIEKPAIFDAIWQLNKTSLSYK